MTAAGRPDGLSAICEKVARIVWGEPSSESQEELRWGTRGSRALDRKKGVWFDHEEGRGGGTLELVPGATTDERMRWLRDRHLIDNRSTNGGRPPSNIVATYDYTDEAGSLLFQVVRFDPKAFRQRRPDGQGGWKWKLGDTRRVLYRLPELLEAAKRKEVVFIVEGERDADNLRALGITATCNPGGANKWRAKHTAALRGADVVICGDTDEPGRKHIVQVAAALHGVAGRLRVLDLAQMDRPAKDISEWLEAGGSLETLLSLIEALPDWQPSANGSVGHNATDGGPNHDAATKDDSGYAADIERLAKLSRRDYERERKAAAERWGFRESILDAEVADRREKSDEGKQGRALTLPEPEPWQEQVSGDELLCSLSAAIRRHVVMPDHAADVTALWVVHSYLLDCFVVSPRLAITSPEKGCGKTTLLDVLSGVVWRPLPTANATAAAIFRVVELQQPTLLIDEADTFLPENEELRGILNSGHRRGGSVLRTVGDDHEPRQFGTYSACAIALIGKLPGTLADRSISVELQRRRADEPAEPFRLDRADHLNELARKAARWASDNADCIRAADPAMPASAINRVADNWRPLLAIADVAGSEWSDRARRAVVAMAQRATDDQSASVQVLTDIRAIFAELQVDRLSSEDLIKALVQMEDRPWAEWKGKPLTKNGLSKLLKSFGIAPDNIRVGTRVPKGYRLAQFADRWERYLSSDGGTQPLHRYYADEMRTSEAFQSATGGPDVAVQECESSNNHGHCSGVAVITHPSPQAANGAAAVGRLCDGCGQAERPAEPLKQWDWPGRPGGIWLHTRCEGTWSEMRGVAMSGSCAQCRKRAE